MSVFLVEHLILMLIQVKIERIHSDIKKQVKENATPQPDPSEIWVSDQDAAAMLQVSKRTMQ